MTVISRSGMETTVAGVSALSPDTASHVSCIKEKLQMVISMKATAQQPKLGLRPEPGLRRYTRSA